MLNMLCDTPTLYGTRRGLYRSSCYRALMPKQFHEIRDPIHVFIRLDTHERRVVDSFPFQRLRHIHQLALSHLVYPGATHRRFEHCLGVMELAGRVFDVVTQPENLMNLQPKTRRQIPTAVDQRGYWRKALRIAAMCHDIGHLPFSHAAEAELLPAGWDHERLTVEIIFSEEMLRIWREMIPPLIPQHIAKLAVGPKKIKHLEARDPGVAFTDWEALLSEIVVGDAFGVDRMDYLLRDAYHAGVTYGRFDHYRLVDTLRILPKSMEDSLEPVLGVEEGGLHAAEALLLARYFMYTQVYMHPVRRIYDIHLQDFLQQWLGGGRFPTEVSEHLKITDNEVVAAMYAAAANPTDAQHVLARRLIRREHFREVYRHNPEDLKMHLQAGDAIGAALAGKYGAERVRRDLYRKADKTPDFPVLTRDGRIVSSVEISQTLRTIPPVAVDSVFMDPKVSEEASDWLAQNRVDILRAAAAAAPKEE